MIKICAEKDGKRRLIKIEGHAMYSKGKDIVCAAVSAIYYSILASVSEDRRIKSMAHKERHGFAELEFYSPDENDGGFNMAVKGFSLIANAYNKNVNFSYISK